MACFRPIRGYRSVSVGRSGKRPIVFSRAAGFPDRQVDLPCGQCIGCRLERSRQWAVRCMHEASMHDENCFLTLTYDDDHLPADYSLDKSHWQKFAKRVRKALGPFRFYMAGEYGEVSGRPHYHACVFGLNFDDRVYFRDSPAGEQLYVSDVLQSLWPFGFSSIGNVTFESAAYVARYVMKKITGEAAEGHYQGRVPEFALMSRRPGIGRSWLERYARDVYPSDEVVVRSALCRPPRYYDNCAGGIVGENVITDVKFERERAGVRYSYKGERTFDRLDVKERVTNSRMLLHGRKL